MSTIEKLFVQIFDRKRQIIEQLNHQKQLYDQHLASKLLIQGITPPPWLLNSDKFASSSSSSSDPEDLNKEELISGLLLPCQQLLPTYSNTTHLYGKPLSTVANSEPQHDLVNATSAGCNVLDDCRHGVLPQYLFRGLEDIHHHVADSPQERVVSDIYPDSDESLARMHRSKSRQKALEIRSSGKVSIKSQLEDKLPTGPRREDMLKEGSATAAGGILSSSKDDSLLKEQDISSKEEGDFRCPTNEADASINWLSPHSVCRDLSLEESLVAADSLSGKDKLDANLLGMQKIEVGESASGSASALGLSNLIASQVVNLLPVELILQDEVVSSQSMQLASVSSVKNKLQGDMYSGGTKCDAHSFEVHRVQEEGPAEIGTTHGLSNEIAGQVVNLCAHEHSCQLQVEQPTSVSSEGMKLVIGSSGKKKLQKGEREQSPAEVASTQGLSAVEVVKMSPEDIHQLLPGQPASIPSEMMTLATSFSGKNKLEGDRYLGHGSLDTDSPGQLKRSAGHSLVETASAHAFSRVISRKLEDLSPEEDFPHLEVEEPKSLSSKRVKHATDSYGEHKVLGESLEEGALVDNLVHMVEIQALKSSAAKLTNELDLDRYIGVFSGENSRASTDECNTEVRFSPCRETAECPGATANELATNELDVDQSLKLSAAKLTNELDLDHYVGVYSGENSSESQGRCETSMDECNTDVRFSPCRKIAECSGATANELDLDQSLKLSTAKLTNELDLDHYAGVYSGKNSRESQGRCEASTDECNTEVRYSPYRKTAECSGSTANELATNEPDLDHYIGVYSGGNSRESQGRCEGSTGNTEVRFIPCRETAECSRAIANELATSNSEDKMKFVSVKQKLKLDDIQSQAAELQANCFSKEVNPKNIFSHGVYVGQSCISDISARKITQNVLSSLTNLSEHASAMQHKELSSQGSSNVEPERLQVSSVSSLSQQLFATAPGCLHKADLTADPADNKIWCEKNSLEVNNTLDCSGGSPFVEHKESVGAEGDISDLESFTFDKKWENSQNIRDTDVNMADKVDDNMEDILKFSPKAQCLQKSLQKVKYFDCLGGSPLEHRDLVGRSASVADLESFTFERKCDDTQDTGDLEGLIAIDLPKNTIDRAKFLERLCRSARLGVPLSHFQASYNSDKKMDICHSVPIGVLEHTDLRNTSALDHMDGQLLKSSHTCTKRVENSELQGNSFDYYSFIHGTQFAWDFKGPYISPVSKAIEGVSAKSRGSSKRGSSNPELTCFPIEESGEEDVIADDNDHNCPEETNSVRISLSNASEEYMNVVALDPTSTMVSLGSVSTESNISASDKQRGSDPEFTCFPVEESSEQDVNVVVPQTCKEKSGSARQPLRDISKNVTALVLHPSPKRGTECFSRSSSTSEANKQIRRSSRVQSHQSEILKKRKKNQNVSLSNAGVKKLYESHHTRFSKPKVSAKSSLESRGGSFAEKEPKPNNIISDIKSFVPLVQQNQEASRAPVKKEIVKSLQAAVAAKQREEKKENERKQRKEAQELERARREQENLRQFELQKKAKEEERKRKDAKIAERKRRREEEGRKEKERKRKRVGEARKQQKGHEDKMSVDKEKCRTHAEDGKTDGRKEPDAGREETMAGGQEVKKVARYPANNPATSSVLPIASGDLNINELGMSSDPCKKPKDVSVVAGCSTPTLDVNYSSTTQTICEKSYDISPYCCSDEEEEDKLPNDKFIPAWASKSSVTKALASLNTLNPELIFPPSSFCSLNEVLLPRQLKQR